MGISDRGTDESSQNVKDYRLVTSSFIKFVSLPPTNCHLKSIFILLTLEFIAAYYGPILSYAYKLINRKHPKYLLPKQYKLKIYTFLCQNDFGLKYVFKNAFLFLKFQDVELLSLEILVFDTIKHLKCLELVLVI